MLKFLWMKHRAVIILIAILALLVVIYWPTLLTQINGSDDPYMIDVGEIQVSLNVWGTIHATGYPLYAILGNLVTTPLRTIGVNPAAAPCLFAMVCGLIALSMFYALVLRLTQRIEIAALTTLLLGLTRTIWVYNVVSKEYNINTIFEIGLLAIALWPPGITADNVRRRVWWLALVGGFGVAHHRTVIFLAPGLLWAAYPGWRAHGTRAIVTLGVALLIGLIGFVPYLYLPARAAAHSDWVYGQPNTLQGFWDQFAGTEASFLAKPPTTIQAWTANILDTFNILGTELTPPLAILSGLALITAMFYSHHKRAARIASVGTLGYFALLFTLHHVVMPQAVAMPIVMLMIFGLALMLDAILAERTLRLPIRVIATIGAAMVIIVLMIGVQRDFIYNLTHNETGLRMIALARSVPREDGHAVMMLPWGPRFHALGFSKFVTKENADLQIVDHNADFKKLLDQGDTIYTVSDTFFGPPFNNAPLPWWDNRVGRVYLSSPAEGLIAIRAQPLTVAPPLTGTPVAHGIVIYTASICLSENTIHLAIMWGAERAPDADLSVFVHLLGSDNPVPLETADSRAPVYGWYPTSRWSAGEMISEHYSLPIRPGATQVKLGMYEQTPQGTFVNYGEQTLPLAGASACNKQVAVGQR